MRKIWISLLVGLFSLVTLAVAPSAQAVSGTAYHPTDPSTGHVRDHHWYKACDRHVDGHRVRLHYYTVFNPHFLLYSAWAPSGGCTQEVGTTLAANISQFRICVEAEGCGPWVR